MVKRVAEGLKGHQRDQGSLFSILCRHVGSKQLTTCMSEADKGELGKEAQKGPWPVQGQARRGAGSKPGLQGPAAFCDPRGRLVSIPLGRVRRGGQSCVSDGFVKAEAKPRCGTRGCDPAEGWGWVLAPTPARVPHTQGL